MKKKMDSLNHLNWSEIIRQAIKDRIEEEAGKNLAKAILLNERVRKIAPENINTVDIIRRFLEESNLSNRNN